MIQKNERRRYASDLNDRQWSIIGPLFPRAGNRSKWEKRELVDAVLYFVDNGCKWRNLPHDFPPYTTVANFYYAAIRSGLWEKIRAALVERVRTDAGRKRHIVVDTMGNLLAVAVHAANIHDTKSGILAARDAFEKYPSIQSFCADAGYRKTFEQDVSRELGLGVDISVRIKPKWEVLPKRWVVERSFAWLNNSRRLAKDYEISVPSARAVCIIVAFRTLLKRF